MSRVAKKPIELPKGVDVALDGSVVKVKGPKGSMEWDCHPSVQVAQEEGALVVKTIKPGQQAVALAGTTRAIVANMVTGVSDGFERRLELRGVGYRAQAQGATLNLT